MAENGEEHLLGIVEIFRVSRRRLSQRLIDRFVEAHQIFEVGASETATRLDPQADDARSQCSILRHHFAYREPTTRATRAMDFCRCVRLAWSRVRIAHRFFLLLVC